MTSGSIIVRMAFQHLSAAEHLRRLELGAVTSVELTQSYLDRVATLDGKVGAFLHVDRGPALQIAAEVDSRRAAKRPVGRLAGLPIAVKDIFCERGQTTTCG